VEKGRLLSKLVEHFDVPKSSLHDRAAGKIQHRSRPGSQSYLTLEEAGELANFLTKCAEIRYVLPQVLALVELMLEHKGIATTLHDGSIFSSGTREFLCVQLHLCKGYIPWLQTKKP